MASSVLMPKWWLYCRHAEMASERQRRNIKVTDIVEQERGHECSLDSEGHGVGEKSTYQAKRQAPRAGTRREGKPSNYQRLDVHFEAVCPLKFINHRICTLAVGRPTFLDSTCC